MFKYYIANTDNSIKSLVWSHWYKVISMESLV